MGNGIRKFFSKQPDEKAKIVLENNGDDIQEPEKVHVPSAGEIVFIQIDQIIPNPAQPRRLFELGRLQTLADSIKTRGIIQPVVVRQVSVSPQKYEVIAGERRLRGAKIAGLSSIPVFIKEVSNKDMRAFALIENMQREDLNTIEKTRAIGELFNDLQSVERVAAALGLSKRIVERYLRIYKFIYSSSSTMATVVQRQAENIDFKTAETMASLFETILRSPESAAEFYKLVNSEGIKGAIEYFMKLIGGRTSRKTDDFFNIVVRKNKLVFTVRYDKHQKITNEDKSEIEHGLRKFFAKLGKS